MSEIHFIRQALAVRRKFRDDASLSLSPWDLHHMSQQHIVVEAAPGNYYNSCLTCMVCRFSTDDLLLMQNHSSLLSHKRNLYRMQLEPEPQTAATHVAEESTSPVLIGNRHIDVKNGAVLDSIFTCRDGMLYEQAMSLFGRCQRVDYYQCELCEINVADIDKYLLHLTGFGHSTRRMRLLDAGFPLYQALWDPSTSGMYFIRLNDNTLHETVGPAKTQMFGYSGVSEISIIPKATLSRFIKLVK